MIFDRLWQGLRKTRETLGSRLRALLGAGRKLDAALFSELEEILYNADLGAAGANALAALEKAWRERQVESSEQVLPFLEKHLLSQLGWGEIAQAPQAPTVVLIAGVNGSGKTTSIAKLAGHLRGQGKTVMLAACDTFRAAAVEQLTIWSERLGVQIVKQATGADPAAVAYDAVEAAASRKVDVLLVDTAGRLHTQKNLMAELEKIRRVLGKRIPGAPHEVLLVLDATTGQNAIVQASEFSKAISVTGIVLAKLDGTAKGGAVFTIREKLGIPVKFVGIGEKIEDLEPFDEARARAFARSLLGIEDAGGAA